MSEAKMELSKEAVVLVAGAGAMGVGIAQVAAAAGHPVRLFDVRDGAAAAAIASIGAALGRQVEKGRMSAEARTQTLANLTAAPDLADLSDVALVIEAVKEDVLVKQALFTDIEARAPANVILATNTSSISVTAIASALRRPDRCAGLHFFNPAPVMALVEVVEGLATDPAVTRTLVDTATAWGKTAVVARSTPGFIVNRVARPFYAEALKVLQEGGGDAATLDAVMRESAGFRMGPFELMDLIGHDVNLAVTQSIHQAYFGDLRFTPSLVQQEMVAAGRLGRKSGQGFYRYGADAPPPSPSQAAAEAAPTAITIEGDLGPAAPLAGLAEGAGIRVERVAGAGYIVIPGATLALTDGRSATVRAAQQGIADLVVFDLTKDWSQATRVALAAADQAPQAALAVAAGFFQALGKTVSVLDDVPGLIGARTVCMLINEAADAVLHGVADAVSIDEAMIKGVGYPRGPMCWADMLGAAWVTTLLDNLVAAYGESRYRSSALLRRVAARDGAFLETPKS